MFLARLGAVLLLFFSTAVYANTLTSGLQYLQQVEKALRTNPNDSSLLLARLRTYYFLSVSEYDSLHGAWKRYYEMKGLLHPDLDSAYKGALHVVASKHALWPPDKLDFLKTAQPLLDNAVTRSPMQIEIRYLRLMSCYYLPFFFGRAWSVREDLSALALLLPKVGTEYPPGLIVKITSFVLENAHELSTDQKKALVERRKLAIQMQKKSNRNEKRIL